MARAQSTEEARPVGPFTRKDREAFGAAATTFALLALLFSVSAFVVAAQADGGGGAPAGGVQVALGEFAITPQALRAPEGGTLVVTNNGAAPHNLTIEGTDVATADLGSGETEVVDLDGVDPGTYTIFCSIAGHREQGMVGTLVVGAGTTAGDGTHAQHDAEEEALRAGNDAADALQKQPVDAYVAQLRDGANTEGVGNQPLAPTVLADGTKEFRLTASIVDWEVEPGKIVRAWAYNAQVPGPWIKVDVGDRVRVVFRNDLPQSSAVHFHGIQTPMGMDGVPFVTQDPVEPGAEFVYEFVASEAQVAMYHSHHHAEHQVPDGLLGVFQVGDMPVPADYAPVVQEVPMVLNDAGVIGLSLNGKSFPATAPVMTRVGETTAIHYYNEGLQIHPMHLHGVPQLVVAKDGFPLPQPYFVDTLNVAPGERYTVLVRPEARHLAADGQTGIWAFHCHILTHAETEAGMRYMVTTLLVNP
jgi:FtsP/CotA-like multicopper oxidase with cupredoxin domain